MINGELDKVTNYWQTTLASIYKVTGTINRIRAKKKKKNNWTKKTNEHWTWLKSLGERKVRWVENKVGRDKKEWKKSYNERKSFFHDFLDRRLYTDFLSLLQHLLKSLRTVTSFFFSTCLSSIVPKNPYLRYLKTWNTPFILII